MSTRGRWWLLSLVSLGLAGCPERPASDPGGPSGGLEAPLEVHASGTQFALQGGAIDEASRKRLVQSAVIKSGEAFALDVELSRPAYAYLLQFRASGGADLLYPAGGDPTAPQAHHKIPSEPDVVLQLDEVTGPEILYLVVSEHPLSEADAELASLLRVVKELPQGAKLDVSVEVDAASLASEPAKLAATDTASPLSSAAVPPVAPTTSSAPSPPPSRASAACAPQLTPIGSTLRARGGCSSNSAVTRVRARGVERKKLSSADLVSATTEASGVGAFPIRLEHR